jgi:hypothetical protein
MRALPGSDFFSRPVALAFPVALKPVLYGRGGVFNAGEGVSGSPDRTQTAGLHKCAIHYVLVSAW